MSNSSFNYFPENKTSSFTVFLPEKIVLAGNWSVAIAEIHFNYNFFNVSPDNNRIISKKKKRTNEEEEEEDISVDGEIPIVMSQPLPTYVDRNGDEIYTQYIEPGYYDDVHSIIIAVNDEIRKITGEKDPVLTINKLNNRAIIDQDCSLSSIELEGRLALQLGFEPEKNILDFDISPHVGNTFFGIPDQMLIYSDIIQPTCIGHEKTHVLKIINTEAKNTRFGDSCYKEFQNLHYVPIQKREFETIAIDIRDYSGKFIPFNHGVLTVKLHFLKSE